MAYTFRLLSMWTWAYGALKFYANLGGDVYFRSFLLKTKTICDNRKYIATWYIIIIVSAKSWTDLGFSEDKHKKTFIHLSCVLLFHNMEISTDQRKQNQRCSTDGHRYSHMNGLIYETKVCSGPWQTGHHRANSCNSPGSKSIGSMSWWRVMWTLLRAHECPGLKRTARQHNSFLLSGSVLPGSFLSSRALSAPFPLSLKRHCPKKVLAWNRT